MYKITWTPSLHNMNGRRGEGGDGSEVREMAVVKLSLRSMSKRYSE